MANISGKRIREYRKQMGYTLDKMSELTGINPSTISRIETDKKSANDVEIVAFASVFGIPASMLIGELPMVSAEIMEALREYADNPDAMAIMLHTIRSGILRTPKGRQALQSLADLIRAESNPQKETQGAEKSRQQAG